MKLVKDLSETGIIYYWLGEFGQRVSPAIPSLPLAEEWRNLYLFSIYQGRERRSSIIDRRKDKEKRREVDKTLFVSRLKPQGRRITDTPVLIDQDRAAEKLQRYL